MPKSLPYLVVGRVLKPWSYRGELKIEILSDFPERFASLREVFLGDDAKFFRVERARLHGKFGLLKLADIDSEADAESLRDQFVQIAAKDAVPLKPNQVYLYQMIGLRVVTVEGESLGEIVDVIDTRANDVYIVNTGTREILLPAIPDVIREIDLPQGHVIVKLLDGLLDV
ncbi:MAG: 16S rRNA processing protein RimM [Chloroflexi bacterium]|nr:16S rRNA processing protein RimM [Chloroflexota bacterium]